jgi:DMSO/TMAO reductase YedYZ molybdopterin-dependent catalytic subunit
MADETLLDRMRAKLIESKLKWAREGRLLTPPPPKRNRLPPGQRLVKNWPVLDLGVQPHVPLEIWKLTIDGAVEAPAAWDWDAFMAQPQKRFVSDIHCVTAWSRYDNHWEGVSAAHVLKIVRPKPEARHVVLHSHDGYTTNVTLEVFSGPDVLVAHSWEGAPLDGEHGGPARLVIPGSYFWKSAKWLRRIEFVAEDRPGFWEERGYHNEGDPWKQQRYG